MSRYLGEGVLKEFLERPNQEKAGTKSNIKMKFLVI